ncbi:MAG TPA: AAA family ATPase [Elusimicrobia bacterium]|nr:MAG: hypothetical protein A2278_09245 [Elusimicrobia bacterium RIFOXYA12_FULL_49_49]OGS06275.1 MAG: hypothetical protein A2204_00365 [Elusimicrobia bacterium RIFOXYA1_FULL_47_7]OGS10978.1 MAG: hypothetical protein A2386_07005 [Elusimicrobia bacterium RIFOXYB1_FULL_48_9]OGS14968.1 MAG: hypothetical protein A2251_08100 [Elusimicrobia bacterium RIFOXYA2_FULL_47_53]OGS26097.1 MAG: hypothetical protein A2339_02175 [Elusimicrobia bacterium RIFOXYB12_FULL_50_12]OGS29313.1 MAG: hypothetical protein
MAVYTAKNLFITGKPGSGKTTLIREACLPYMDKAGGFYTEEIIEDGKRGGFVIKTFSGRQGVLARKGMPSAHKLNKYGIDVSVLEGIAVKELERAVETKPLIVIDEIGSMEIISESFRKTLVRCFASGARVLATIRYNAQPFTDEIKKMPDSELIVLTRENHEEIKRRVREWMSLI